MEGFGRETELAGIFTSRISAQSVWGMASVPGEGRVHDAHETWYSKLEICTDAVNSIARWMLCI